MRRRISIHLKQVAPWLGAVLSGGLLFAAFPPMGLRDAAWIALVPLLISVRTADAGKAFRLGYLAGLLFWLGTLHWLTHVSAVGWVLLALYCAIYPAAFATFVAAWLRRLGAERQAVNLLLMLCGAAVWVALEWLRSWAFTGFAWHTLGISQYQNLPLIQCSSWGGVYAVSALLVFANLAVAATVLRYATAGTRRGRSPHPELLLAVLAVAVVVVGGWRRLRTGDDDGTELRVGLVQPNIPQADYYRPERFPEIYKSVHFWSLAAAQGGGIDLLVWPETALPLDIREHETAMTLIRETTAHGIPLLAGTTETEYLDDGRQRYFNSSLLFGSDGVLRETYDKRHLVIFGEYVPLRRWLPFLTRLTPIQESFTAGTTSTIFRLVQPEVPFSVLICFEDTLPYIARDAVRAGARLLVNQTNDAWFDPSSASLQHMSHCVFRCIENNVPAFRAANTGVTCAIDRHGRILRRLTDDHGAVRVAGFLSTAVSVPSEDAPLTLYTRHGDFFARLCAACSFLALGFLVWARSKTASTPAASIR